LRHTWHTLCGESYNFLIWEETGFIRWVTTFDDVLFSEGFTMTRILASVRCFLARVQVRALLKQEEGASLVEYGLLVGLIAVVCIGAITLLGQDISSLFSRIAAKMEGVAP
jgi:pilus assembly protein Flp/PilA